MIQSRELWAGGRGVTRREFAVRAGLGLAGLALAGGRVRAQDMPRSELALARKPDRLAAVRTAVELLGVIDFGGKDLYIKGNYNSSDPFPATTHPDMLEAVVGLLRERNCGKLTLIERSGMGITRDVWQKLGVVEHARKLDLELIALDTLREGRWRKEPLPGSTWNSGIEVPTFLDFDSYVVQICNLKTHRFGGVFSASLKNSVGLIAKYGRVDTGYNYMAELHSSPQQGSMIAEVNVVYQPKLVIMDAMKVFTSGGPEKGAVSAPEVVVVSADRLAVDAVGVALLRMQDPGPNQPLNWRPIYQQEQLKRAAELDLGAASGSEIRFLTADSRSSRLATQFESMLSEPAASSESSSPPRRDHR